MVRERLKVENITERYSKARLRWFGHGQGEMKVENIPDHVQTTSVLLYCTSL